MSCTQLCRLCLATDMRLVAIVHTTLQDFYEKLTNISFNSIEKPEVACYLCVTQLKKCQELAERATRADKLLTEMLHAGTEITSKSIVQVDRNAHKLSANLDIALISLNGFEYFQPVLEVKKEVPSDIEDVNCDREDMQTEPNDLPNVKEIKLNDAIHRDSIAIKIEIDEHGIPEKISKESRELGAEEKTHESQTNSLICPASGENINSNNLVNNCIDESNQLDSNKISKILSEKKLYKCTVCEYRCNKNSLIVRHLRTHTGEKPYKCTVCEYRSNVKSTLKNHLRTHSGDKPYKCTVCEYRCNQKSSLTRHLRTHTGEKPHKCTVCEYRFNAKSTLKNHLRTHTGEKPYKCTVCEFRSIKKSVLMRHVTTHTGEKAHKCTVCEYRCNDKSVLNTHLRTHTGEKPYECSECEFRCKDKSSLNRHLRIHTGEKPHECKVCNYRFSTKFNLNKHLKIHTREIM